MLIVLLELKSYELDKNLNDTIHDEKNQTHTILNLSNLVSL